MLLYLLLGAVIALAIKLAVRAYQRYNLPRNRFKRELILMEKSINKLKDQRRALEAAYLVHRMKETEEVLDNVNSSIHYLEEQLKRAKEIYELETSLR